MKSLQNNRMVEQGRVIARELNKIKVQQKERVTKAVQRKSEKLSQAADKLFNNI